MCPVCVCVCVCVCVRARVCARAEAVNCRGGAVPAKQPLLSASLTSSSRSNGAQRTNGWLLAD